MRTNFDQLLEAGCHFGHLKRKWNPAMAPYIYMERNGIHIIDLNKTAVKIDEAAEALKNLAKQGRKVLFVGTKKQAQEVVAQHATEVGMPYITERWAGGMLTNFPTIRKAVKKMSSIDKMMTDGTFDNISKRERLQITRQREKLRLAIARALVKINPEDKSALKAEGFMTRDAREVERKKPGQPKARKHFQFSKR